jgi:hypothetical protein
VVESDIVASAATSFTFSYRFVPDSQIIISCVSQRLGKTILRTSPPNMAYVVS